MTRLLEYGWCHTLASHSQIMLYQKGSKSVSALFDGHLRSLNAISITVNDESGLGLHDRVSLSGHWQVSIRRSIIELATSWPRRLTRLSCSRSYWSEIRSGCCRRNRSDCGCRLFEAKIGLSFAMMSYPHSRIARARRVVRAYGSVRIGIGNDDTNLSSPGMSPKKVNSFR